MNRLPPLFPLCAAVVALAACGSGASAPPGSTPAAATSAPPGPLVDRPTPTVRVGPFVVTFATPLPADPAKAQVIEGFREDEILWDQAAYSWHLGPALVDHVTGKALAHLAAAVSYSKKYQAVPAGPDRYYRTTVASLTGSRATVTTCEGGPGQVVNRRTGKIIRALSAPGHSYHLFEQWTMLKLGGHWALASFSAAAPPDPRAARCIS